MRLVASWRRARSGCCASNAPSLNLAETQTKPSTRPAHIALLRASCGTCRSAQTLHRTCTTHTGSFDPGAKNQVVRKPERKAKPHEGAHNNMSSVVETNPRQVAHVPQLAHAARQHGPARSQERHIVIVKHQSLCLLDYVCPRDTPGDTNTPYYSDVHCSYYCGNYEIGPVALGSSTAIAAAASAATPAGSAGFSSGAPSIA